MTPSPCPFCGGATERHMHTEHIERSPLCNVYYVVCQLCGCKGPRKKSESSAIRHWNRRFDFESKKTVFAGTCKEEILYALARHVLNKDKIDAPEWGAEGLIMLSELRAVDPDMFDRYVHNDQTSHD